MIEIRQLQHMLALAEQANFKRAAKVLGISQPALTKSIQRLESVLGVPLFDRGTKSVELTQFGQAVIDRARKITSEYDAIPGEIDLLTGLHRGELAIGSGPLNVDGVMAEAVVRLTESHPNLRVVIQIDDWRSLTGALHRGEISLFVAETSEALADKHFDVQPLSSLPGIWFANMHHPLSERVGLTMNELADYPIFTPKLPDRIIAWFEQNMPKFVRPERLPSSISVVECDDYALIKRMVRAGVGLSIAPWTIIKDEVQRGLLVALDVTEPIFRSNSGIITMHDRSLPPAARALIAELLSSAKSMEQSDAGAS